MSFFLTGDRFVVGLDKTGSRLSASIVPASISTTLSLSDESLSFLELGVTAAFAGVGDEQQILSGDDSCSV